MQACRPHCCPSMIALTHIPNSCASATRLQVDAHAHALRTIWEAPILRALQDEDVGALHCSTCNMQVNMHTVQAVDLNRLRPQAALWPHEDIAVGGAKTSVLLCLLQPATIGGCLRVARVASHVTHGTEHTGVAWRAVDKRSTTLARRARDTESTGMQIIGDSVLLDGCSYVHEVTKVCAGMDRLSLSVTLRCPSAL